MSIPCGLLKSFVCFVTGSGLQNQVLPRIGAAPPLSRRRVYLPGLTLAYAEESVHPIEGAGLARRDPCADFGLLSFVGSLGRECGWLVPYRRVSGEIGPWSDAMLRKLKGELSRGRGVAFSLKTFRATFAQMYERSRRVHREGEPRPQPHVDGNDGSLLRPDSGGRCRPRH